MRYPLFLALCLAVVPHDPRPADLPVPAAPVAEVQDDGSALPDDAGLERLAHTDPVAFLEACLRRYDREVHGYRVTLHKHERLEGKLPPPEVIDVAFREKPFSVLFDWREGAGRAQRTLYVRGENDDKLLVRPAGWRFHVAGIVTRDPEGPDARAAGRYPLPGFGIKIGTQRVLTSWQEARKRGELHVEYVGRQRVPELGNRMCHVLRRQPYARPEEDGITSLVMYVDVETWLQVGTVLEGDNGLIGEYFFRDVRLNPEFPAETFTRQTLEK
jgi:hypothetical protein